MAMRRRLTVDLGPLLWFRCPDCYENGILRLACTHQSSGRLLIRFLFPKLFTPDFAVVCESCQWPEEIDPPERAGVEKLQALTREFQSGRIEAQAYFARILETAPGILEKLRIAGEHWILKRVFRKPAAESGSWSPRRPARIRAWRRGRGPDCCAGRGAEPGDRARGRVRASV